jgi:hypothetical protein
MIICIKVLYRFGNRLGDKVVVGKCLVNSNRLRVCSVDIQQQDEQQDSSQRGESFQMNTHSVRWVGAD